MALDPTAELNAFQASEVIYRCVEEKSSQLASVDLVVVRDGEYDPDHPTANVFNKSSADAENAVARKRIMWQQLAMRGESFLFMDRGETAQGEPTDFIVIMDRVTPLFAKDALDKDGNRRPMTVREMISRRLTGYEVDTVDHGKLTLLPSEVLWLRYPHFALPWSPMAPGTAAMMAAGLDKEARRWQLSEFANQARPSGVMNLGNLTEDKANIIKQQFQAQATGTANAGRVVFLYGGDDRPNFSRVGLTPAEMSYLESHRMNGVDICVAMGFPVDLIFGQSTFDNQDAAWRRAWASWDSGDLTLVSAEIDRQLFPEPGIRAVFDTRAIPALQENTDAIHERAIKAWMADGLTFDRFRKRIGEDPFGDARDGMTYSEYQRVISAAPTPVEAENVIPIADRRMAIEVPEHAATIQDVAEALREPTERRRAISVERVLRAYDTHERQLKRSVERLAADQERQVLKALDINQRKREKALEKRAEPPPIDPEDVFDRIAQIKATIEALEAAMELMYTDAALSTANALGSEASPLLMERVIATMRGRLDVLAKQVTETTYRTISEEILKPGVEEGEGIPKLAARIKDRFTDLKTYRAETIARTETLGGTSEASFLAARESGVVTDKTWVAANDLRVRDSHKEMDNETVPMDATFSNGLMFPGDPRGTPDQTINCRCVPLWEVGE